MKKRDKTHGGIKVSEKSGRERSRPHNALSSNKSLDKKTKQNGFNQWISNLDKATELCLQLETRWHSRSFNGIILDQDKNRLIVICKLLANGYQELLKHGKNISDENKIVLNFLVRIITTLEEINKHQTTTKILENLPLLINHLKELSPIKIPSPFENSYKLKSIIQALNSLNRELEPHSIIFYFRTDIQYSSLDQAIFNELFYLRNRFKEKIQNLIEHSIQTGSIQRSFERYAAQMLMLYKNINAMLETALIAEVKIPNMKSKYEIVKLPHAHLLCDKCGEFKDILIDLEPIIRLTEDKSNYKLNDTSLIFSGLCEKCK